MASGRIVIPVGLETRGVTKGAKDAEKSLKDLEDAVTDTGKDGARDLDKLEDELKDVQRQSDKTGRDIGRNMDDGFDKAKKGVNEFKDEANSTAREAAASFDGSAESIGDAFQEVAANALGGFGPLGAAAGIALAAGIGAGTAALTGMQEASEETKAKIREMYQQAAEDGQAYLDETVIQQETTRLMFEERTKLQGESKRLGIDVVTLARAYAGDQEAINTAIDAGNGLVAERKQKQDEATTGVETTARKVDLEAEAIRNVLAELEAVQTEHERNKETAQQVVDAQKQQTTEAGRTRDALKAMADGTYRPTITPVIDWRSVQEFERWAANGLKVSVNALNGGKTWE